jgi:hypothetical protein
MKFEDELRNKIKEMIEKSPIARKDYMYVDLCSRIRDICTMNFDEFSDPVLSDNLQKLGFRIFRIKMEVGETECNRLIDKAVDKLLEERGENEEFREYAIQNIEWVLKLYREHHEEWGI